MSDGFPIDDNPEFLTPAVQTERMAAENYQTFPHGRATARMAEGFEFKMALRPAGYILGEPNNLMNSLTRDLNLSAVPSFSVAAAAPIRNEPIVSTSLAPSKIIIPNSGNTA